MKFLIIFFLLTSICFAQEIWQYKSIVRQEIDIAGKYRVWVLISNGQKEEAIILKFQTKPTTMEIKEEIEKVCYSLNNPSLLEPTIEELKEIIRQKDIQIEILTKQISVVK